MLRQNTNARTSQLKVNTPLGQEKDKTIIKLKQTEDEVLLQSPKNEQMMSLNKARQELIGKDLKNFEVMDGIYQKVRNKTNENLHKLDGMLHIQAKELYYDKKADIYQLLKDKKKADEDDIQKFLEMNQVPINYRQEQEQEIKRICKEFNIDLKSMRLPYREKIRQICNNFSAFYRYKKDQREILDQNLLKNSEYVETNMMNEEYLRVLMRVQYIGEHSLTEQEQILFRKLKDLRKLNISLDKRQEFYLNQFEKKKKLQEDRQLQLQQILAEKMKKKKPFKLSDFKNKSQQQANGLPIEDLNDSMESLTINTSSTGGNSPKLANAKESSKNLYKSMEQKLQVTSPIKIDDRSKFRIDHFDTNMSTNDSGLSKVKQFQNARNLNFKSQDHSKQFIEIQVNDTQNEPRSINQLPQIKKLNLDGAFTTTNQSISNQKRGTRNQQNEKTFISLMRFPGDTSARTNEQSTDRQTAAYTHTQNSHLDTSVAYKKYVQSQQNSPRQKRVQTIDQMLRRKLQPIRLSQDQQSIIENRDRKYSAAIKERYIQSQAITRDNSLQKLGTQQSNDIQQLNNDDQSQLQQQSTQVPQFNEQQSQSIFEEEKVIDKNKLIRQLIFNNPPNVRADFQRIKRNIDKNHQNRLSPLYDKRRGLQRVEFKEKTPTLNDDDIKRLLRLYPPSKIENEKKAELEIQKERKWQRKQLESILKNVDKIEHQNKTEKDKIIYQMLIQNIKDDEFMKTVEKLKEIDFAESVVLQTLFEYKLKDEHDQADLANEVAKEYHSGKLDPLLALRIERKNKMKQNQKIQKGLKKVN
ncbi:UNKNOWN [Stylonychia lemnae]|uniref:Uncharacterized protein n=1 Tax=Stylonychia lemnae TaxID=5949 RepID=A0A078AJN8_STYLE|nr:UNKNOWN [Stylonychia lemnae]|eukprot:CDW81687.1 UNKNOWN [Stylonychia lemnae]